MPLIKIIATGGTIVNTDRGLISVAELLKDIPQAQELADFELAEAVRVRSGSIQLNHWLDIARLASEAANDPTVDGIIITHGTFTVEETAYFLHLTVQTRKPIVCVASQRPHSALGNDGDRNFLDAVKVALSPQAVCKGVLVVLHEEIHSAREVIKTNQRPGGFASPAHGILGHIEEDGVNFYNSPLRRHTFHSEFDIRAIRDLPRVDLVMAYVGADDAAAQACVKVGAQGLVVNGYAFNGNPAPGQREGLERLATSGVPIVLCSRGGQGRVPTNWQDPFIQGDTLVAHKARILLMLGLTKTKDPRELQRVFSEY